MSKLLTIQNIHTLLTSNPIQNWEILHANPVESHSDTKSHMWFPTPHYCITLTRVNNSLDIGVSIIIQRVPVNGKYSVSICYDEWTNTIWLGEMSLEDIRDKAGFLREVLEKINKEFRKRTIK